MKLDFATYKDKVTGCWAGKNIGGVLGAPYECKRQFNEIDFYTQDLSNGPPPNDDLDLQIVWLTAVEKYGRQIDSSILAEYWLSYVIPNWVEYGTGKANLAAGLRPPFSGYFDNPYRNSCGCFIRSEIWACLAPGHPEIAVRYAYEDGIVDHSGEGVYGEIFCAAIQSAAFVESNLTKLLEIGLSYIPSDSAVARCVRKAAECYSNKLPLTEARIIIHNEAPGTFGALGYANISDFPTDDGKLEIGIPGFDCPENIGFLIAGLLYGEGDLGKSLCTAVAFGEDTDCTAATLGALFGIIHGASGLPEKWTAPLNDKIKTMCINLTAWGAIKVPETVTQLTDHVLRVTPLFLGIDTCDIFSENGYTINCLESNELFCSKDDYLLHHNVGPHGLTVRELVNLSPNNARYSFPTHTVTIDYGNDIFFNSYEQRKFKITIMNNNSMCQQLWCRVKMYTPENVKVIGGSEFSLQLNNLYGDKAEVVFSIDATEFKGDKIESIIDISLLGRHSSSPVKIVLLRKNE